MALKKKGRKINVVLEVMPDGGQSAKKLVSDSPSPQYLSTMTSLTHLSGPLISNMALMSGSAVIMTCQPRMIRVVKCCLLRAGRVCQT